MTKLMKDVFKLPVSVKGYRVVEEYISEIECDNEIDAEYVAHAINNHDTLTEQYKQLVGQNKDLAERLQLALCWIGDKDWNKDCDESSDLCIEILAKHREPDK